MREQTCRGVMGRLALVLLALSCGGEGVEPPTTGSLEVTAATSGPEQDADGYALMIDGAETAIGASASVRREGVEAGSHSVELRGVATNCTVAGENPRSVEVVAGSTATVAFAITCTVTTGSLQISSSTTGPSTDPDGYTITLDGSDRGTLAPIAELRLEELAPGDHAVGLGGVAANCQVQGDNPRLVTVAAGASATATFAVVCAAPPPVAGSIRITTSTSGPDQDADGYLLALDGGATQPIGANAAQTLANVAAGAHTIQLSGAAGNCSVGGTSLRSVTVSDGATTDINFAVTCRPTTGAIRVSVTSSGSPADPDGYSVSVDGGAAVAIARDGTHDFERISAGTHRVALTGLAANCRANGENPRNVTVMAAATLTASFTVTCSSTGATQWTPIPLPAGFSGRDIWGTSATDLFVTGSNAGVPSILHYDGRSWSEQFRRTDGGLEGLWGSSATDIFAAVYTPSGLAPILHYDGARWSETAGPLQSGDARTSTVWGTSSRDVFAGGSQSLPGTYRVLLAHYDGAGWSEMPAPEVGGDYAAIHGISGSSSTDVYAIGANQICDGCNHARNFVAHYDGTGWTESFETIDNDLTGIWVGASNDVWVVGEGFDHEGYILHFDGSRWTGTLRRTPEGNVEPPLSDVWGRSGSDIYAVGEGGILHYDGATWTPINPTPGKQVWGTTAGDVFVLGADAVLHGTH